MMLMRKIHGGIGKANSKDEVKSEASNDEGNPEDESDEEQYMHTYTTKRPKEENILHFTLIKVEPAFRFKATIAS